MGDMLSIVYLNKMKYQIKIKIMQICTVEIEVLPIYLKHQINSTNDNKGRAKAFCGFEISVSPAVKVLACVNGDKIYLAIQLMRCGMFECSNYYEFFRKSVHQGGIEPHTTWWEVLPL